MNLTIKEADNGFVLSYYDPDIKEIRHIAIEDVDKDVDCVTEARLTQKLLWEVMEHFMLFGNKHDSERCYVVIKNQKGEEIDA